MPTIKSDWREKSLRLKISAIFSLTILSAIAGTSLYSYQQYKNHLISTKTEQLKSIRSAKSRQIEAYFKQVRNQIETLSESIMVIDAANEFKHAYDEIKPPKFTNFSNNEYELGLYDYYKNEFSPRVQRKNEDNNIAPYVNISPTAKYLQYQYIFANPNPTSKKDKFLFAKDQSNYSKVHQQYHAIFRKYLKKFGYYDILIVEPNSGDILYSVYKEVDYATSLMTGPYKDSNLGRLFREVRASNHKDFVKLIDFEPYLPSYNRPTSFIGSPIYDGDKKVGVLIFQMPIDEINSIMTGDQNWFLEGLGYSGETILVGSDYKMRSQSRLLIENPEEYYQDIAANGASESIIDHIKKFKSAILLQKVGMSASEKALKGGIGEDVIRDYRNQDVLIAYLPLNIADVEWAFIAKYDISELFNELAQLALNTFMGILISLLVLFSFALYFSRNTSLPFETLKRYTSTLLDNNQFHSLNLSKHHLANQLGSNINSIGQAIDQHLKFLEQIPKGNLLRSTKQTHTQSNKLETAALDVSNYIALINQRYNVMLSALINQNQTQNINNNKNIRRATMDLKRHQKMNQNIASAARENKLISTINEKVTQQVSIFIEQQREIKKELVNVNSNIDDLMNEHVHRDLMKRYIKDFGTHITTIMRKIRREGVENHSDIRVKLEEMDHIFKRMDSIYNEHFDMEYTKVLLISKEIKKIAVYFEVQSNRENLMLDISKEREKRIQMQFEQLEELNQLINQNLSEIQSNEISAEQMSTLLTQFSCASTSLEDRFIDPSEYGILQQENRHQRAG